MGNFFESEETFLIFRDFILTFSQLPSSWNLWETQRTSKKFKDLPSSSRNFLEVYETFIQFKELKQRLRIFWENQETSSNFRNLLRSSRNFKKIRNSTNITNSLQRLLQLFLSSDNLLEVQETSKELQAPFNKLRQFLRSSGMF